MAQLIIEVPDAAVPRIRLAFGRDEYLTNVRLPATVSEVQGQVKRFIKDMVKGYEATQASKSVRETVSKEEW